MKSDVTRKTQKANQFCSVVSYARLHIFYHVIIYSMHFGRRLHGQAVCVLPVRAADAIAHVRSYRSNSAQV